MGTPPPATATLANLGLKPLSPGLPPPPTDTCTTPGSASHSHSGRPSPSWKRSLHAWEGQARWHGSVPRPAPQSLASVPEISPGPTENAFPCGSLWSWGAPCEGHSEGSLCPPSPEPPEDPSRTPCSHLVHSPPRCHARSHTHSISHLHSLSFTHTYSHSPTHSCLFLYPFRTLSHSDTLNTPPAVQG